MRAVIVATLLLLGQLVNAQEIKPKAWESLDLLDNQMLDIRNRCTQQRTTAEKLLCEMSIVSIFAARSNMKISCAQIAALDSRNPSKASLTEQCNRSMSALDQFIFDLQTSSRASTPRR